MEHSFTRLYLLSALMVAFLAGCPGLRTQAVDKSPAGGRGLELGTINVETSLVHEVLPGEKRVDLGDLLKAATIFSTLQGSRQSVASSASGNSTSASVTASALLPSSATTQSGQSLVVQDGGAPSPSSSSRTSTTKAPVPPAAAPTAAIPFASADASGVSPAYHHLLYDTADTMLGGEALQDLYNVASIPPGWHLYIVPLIAAFSPGRVTRTNYFGDAEVTFPEHDGKIQIIAVAPAGFADVGTQAFSHLRRLQLALALGVPIGPVGVAANVGNTIERLETLARIAVRPELSVTIEDHNKLDIRYRGSEGFKGNVTLQPRTFNLEAIVLTHGKVLMQGRPAGASNDQPPSAPSGRETESPRGQRGPDATHRQLANGASPGGGNSNAQPQLRVDFLAAPGVFGAIPRRRASPTVEWLAYQVTGEYKPLYKMDGPD